jgi:hypothetical protein
MTSLWKLLRRSCAIATSGALMLSSFPTLAQDQPPAAAQVPPPAAVQQPPQPAAQQLGQGELEKLLAPIALYPDDLVVQILTASTYPIEVVEASRWVSAHPNLHGDALQNAMQQQPWDPSVKGLTAVSQWSVEESEARFVVRDHNGQQLAYVYFEDEPGRLRDFIAGGHH